MVLQQRKPENIEPTRRDSACTASLLFFFFFVHFFQEKPGPAGAWRRPRRSGPPHVIFDLPHVRFEEPETERRTRCVPQKGGARAVRWEKSGGFTRRKHITGNKYTSGFVWKKYLHSIVHGRHPYRYEQET